MAAMVDLRSDTVTRPTALMRAAIAAAEVGDDVLGDDPTVFRLQERVAAWFGKEAALFVPSGTMANLLAIRSVCEHGDELILDETTHSYHYETAGPAAIAGVSMRFLRGPRGVFHAAEIAPLIRPRESHFPRTRMVIVENTNNRGGGAVWPPEQVAQIGQAAQTHGLHLHLDGARLLNACIARGVAPGDYTRHADSCSLCFSKGLGAPVGSILAGSRAFIERAHRFRKMLGGGMRQSGLLAAAALYALDNHVERLAVDHAHAKVLAEALAAMPGIRLNPAEVETNIVIFGIDERLGSADDFAARLNERGVRLFSTGPQTLRAVTHLDVQREAIDRAIGVFRALCSAL